MRNKNENRNKDLLEKTRETTLDFQRFNSMYFLVGTFFVLFSILKILIERRIP